MKSPPDLRGQKESQKTTREGTVEQNLWQNTTWEWLSEGGEANPAAQLEVHYKWEESYFPCQDDNPKKNCKILGVNTPGQKCDCKLGEIQLENCVINMKQLLAANMTANWEKSSWKMVFWKSGQTGGAAKSALASTWNDLRKWWGCLGLGHVVQNPMMYDTWGGASHFFSARSLRSKIPRSQGIRSPDPLPKWVGEPD